ncbi:hypothetical protein Y032_0023g823 [Ancylostoma ceylanicum]|uniref:Uncharacterized protein n=1 Tax=Ancylostoma ceylanicum TaxID=53326 RepID=A0A016UZ07_9BILA|nr:hypothetical protein Y032_0023g823 [Ancylostoma ceylanicum]
MFADSMFELVNSGYSKIQSNRSFESEKNARYNDGRFIHVIKCFFFKNSSQMNNKESASAGIHERSRKGSEFLAHLQWMGLSRKITSTLLSCYYL